MFCGWASWLFGDESDVFLSGKAVHFLDSPGIAGTHSHNSWIVLAIPRQFRTILGEWDIGQGHGTMAIGRRTGP